MTLRLLAGFLALAAFDTLAQVCFKLAAAHALPLEPNAAWLARLVLQPYAIGAALAVSGAFITWMRLLGRVPLGVAFAASHLQVVTVLAVSSVFFHEALTPVHIAGAALILLGIACLSSPARSRTGASNV